MYKFSDRSLRELVTTDGEIQRLMILAIKESPVDFTIIEGLRTQKRQQELYKEGRVNDRPILTYMDGVKKKSKHQTGRAIDICPYVNGQLDWTNVKAFEEIAAHIKEIAIKIGVKIEWGGDWKMKDRPHWELYG